VKVQAVFELDLSDMSWTGLALHYGKGADLDELFDNVANWERQVLEQGNVRDYELVNVEVIL
jgi:hypothetical protein